MVRNLCMLDMLRIVLTLQLLLYYVDSFMCDFRMRFSHVLLLLSIVGLVLVSFTKCDPKVEDEEDEAEEEEEDEEEAEEEEEEEEDEEETEEGGRRRRKRRKRQRRKNTQRSLIACKLLLGHGPFSFE